MKSARAQILKLTEDHYREEFPVMPFIPGVTPVPVSGRTFNAQDVRSLVDASLDFWLTGGRFTQAFERKFAEYNNVNHAVFVNSGSSANLLALTCLMSPLLKTRALVAGDEVITVAAGFPTTVNPIFQNNLVPVFIDVNIPTYNANPELLSGALSSRTRAVVLAHALGNPFDIQAVAKFCKDNDLWLISDSCDALGSVYNGRQVGSYGDISTYSFYPAHHITAGEGGMVTTGDGRLKKIITSFRDWGRDCFCKTGCDDTCGNRFGWKLGEMPFGYDHKYVYSHIGYNLKATDMQAAIGHSQMDSLPEFTRRRRENFDYIYQRLSLLNDVFILPEATPGSEPSWFGFPLCIREDAKFSRSELIKWLTKNKIGARLLFGGNLTKQPAYLGKAYRVAGELRNTDVVMNNVFWLGVYPGLTRSMLEFMCDKIEEFVHGKN